MTQLWRAFGSMAPLLLVCAPVAMAFLAWRTHRLRQDASGRTLHPIVRALLEAMAGLNLVVAAAITLSPSSGERGRVLDHAPFIGIVEAAQQGAITAEIVQAAANLLLFIPFGLYLGLVLRLRVLPSLVAGVALGTLVELAQWALATGRAASAEDAVLNAAGVFVAAAVGRTVTRSRATAAR